MRTHHAFRPWLMDCLEDRVVPSGSGLTSSATLLGITVTLPAQVHTGSPQVQAAIGTFDHAYEQAVETVLLAPGPGGSINLAANRAAFDAVVIRALDTLASNLVQTLGTGSTTSTAAGQVQDAIIGNNPTSLESQLLALPTLAIEQVTATGSNSISVPSNTGSTPVPLPSLAASAEQARSSTLIRIPQGLPEESTDLVGTTTTGSSDVTQDIRQAFGAFLEDYFHAVQGVLLANQGGAVDPTAARGQFDAQVARALQALNGNLGTTLGRYPGGSSLANQVQKSIAGDDATSLKAQLKGLATPNSPQAALVREFTIGSIKVVADALSAITGNVSQALKPRQ